MTKAYALRVGEGRTYDWNSGFMFTIKAAGPETEGRLGFMEFVTRKGQEPTPHVHPDEDEIFYVIEGSLTVTCGDDTFDVEERGFIYLPRNIRHGYKINSDGPVRMLVLTTPSDFPDRIEQEGTRV